MTMKSWVEFSIDDNAPHLFAAYFNKANKKLTIYGMKHMGKNTQQALVHKWTIDSSVGETTEVDTEKQSLYLDP